MNSKLYKDVHIYNINIIEGFIKMIILDMINYAIQGFSTGIGVIIGQYFYNKYIKNKIEREK